MTLVLLVLAVVWAAVLIPPALRSRAEGRPGDSISAFRRQLAGLNRTTPRSIQVPLAQPASAQNVRGPNFASPGSPAKSKAVRSRTLKRRRDILTGLLATVAFTLLLAIFFGGAFWTLNVFFDLALGGYVGLLVRLRNVTAEREMKVRFLPFAVPLDPMAEPVLLRQSAN